MVVEGITRPMSSAPYPFFTPQGYVTCAIVTLGSALVISAVLAINFVGVPFIVETNTKLQEGLVANVNTTNSIAPSFLPLTSEALPSALRWFSQFLTESLSCGQYGIHSVALAATLPSVSYWLVSWVLMLVDMRFEATGRLGQAKTFHPGFVPKIEHRLYRKAVYLGVVVTVWSWFVHAALFHPLQRYLNEHSMCREGTPMFPTDLVQLAIVLVKLYVMWLLTDVVFYSTHRLCHEVPFLYKNIHKVHHQWVISYGVDASTCHPLEHLMVNMMTVELPAIIVGLPLHIHTLWTIAASINTVCNHSGYNILGTVTHDRHHHYNNCEFGTDTFCDRWFGTTFKDRNPQLFDKNGKLLEVAKKE